MLFVRKFATHFATSTSDVCGRVSQNNLHLAGFNFVPNQRKFNRNAVRPIILSHNRRLFSSDSSDGPILSAHPSSKPFLPFMAANSETEKLFNPRQFDTTLNICAIRVPKEKCGTFMKMFKRNLLDRPRIKCVINDPANPSGPNRLVLLNEKFSDLNGLDLPDELRKKLEDESALPLVHHEVHLDYSYFTADHVLTALLPEGVEVPGSFETIGHVAHLNLRDNLLPFKKLIGRVILDKNLPRIQTILNKVGTIENTFRVPEFEVLAGKSSLETEVKQHGCIFKLDFGLVYWNSRLEKEHERLVEKYLTPASIEEGSPPLVVCDMMAGIGPFAIPAAKKGCKVFANDLNPDSTKYLQINAKTNKVEQEVSVFTMCGREFVRFLLGSPRGEGEGAAPHSHPQAPVMFSHVLMNLPATAVEFLDVFKGAFNDKDWTAESLPMIHCYLFARTAETHADIIQRAEGHLGGKIEDAAVHPVRDVAPNKHMYCLSFKLLPEVAFAKTSCQEPKSDEAHSEAKRLKTGE